MVVSKSPDILNLARFCALVVLESEIESILSCESIRKSIETECCKEIVRYAYLCSPMTLRRSAKAPSTIEPRSYS